MDQKLADVAA